MVFHCRMRRYQRMESRRNRFGGKHAVEHYHTLILKFESPKTVEDAVI